MVMAHKNKAQAHVRHIVEHLEDAAYNRERRHEGKDCVLTERMKEMRGDSLTSGKEAEHNRPQRWTSAISRWRPWQEHELDAHGIAAFSEINTKGRSEIWSGDEVLIEVEETEV